MNILDQPIDIIQYILYFLDKNSSFNFLNTCKKLTSLKYILYQKYIFDDKKINNSKIKKYIKNVKGIDMNFDKLFNYPNILSEVNVDGNLSNN